LAELEASFDHIATDMTTHTQPTTAKAGERGQRILAVLRTRLRAARTAELPRRPA
jgi:hypothetical protein